MAIISCIHAFNLDSDDDAPKAFNRSMPTCFRRESRRNQTYCERIAKNIPDDDRTTDLPPIIDEKVPAPHHYMAFVDLRNTLAHHLGLLSERERRLICKRFTLDKTYCAIARDCGLSASQVCKIVCGALVKMKVTMTVQGHTDTSP